MYLYCIFFDQYIHNLNSNERKTIYNLKQISIFEYYIFIYSYILYIRHIELLFMVYIICLKCDIKMDT